MKSLGTLLLLFVLLAPNAPGAAEAIGSAAAGCLRDAGSLPLTGGGYQVIRPARQRFWSHPATLSFVRDLAAAARQQGVDGILVGDLGGHHGGPMPSGHASHQNGLDVDIWFRLESQALSGDDLEAPRAVPMVEQGHLSSSWGRGQETLLRLAAQSSGVDRIFVNPVIKQALCRALPEGERGWLSKLRPWWGHDSHFHVRMTCPADSPSCEIQKPVPDGDGCGAEVESWLEKPTSPAPPERPHVQTRPLPEACRAVLAGK